MNLLTMQALETPLAIPRFIDCWTRLNIAIDQRDTTLPAYDLDKYL